MSKEQLFRKGNKIFNNIIIAVNKLFKDKNISNKDYEILLERRPYLIYWDADSPYDPAFYQVRFTLRIYKKTRKVTKREIYKTVNNIWLCRYS